MSENIHIFDVTTTADVRGCQQLAALTTLLTPDDCTPDVLLRASRGATTTLTDENYERLRSDHMRTWCDDNKNGLFLRCVNDRYLQRSAYQIVCAQRDLATTTYEPKDAETIAASVSERTREIATLTANFYTTVAYKLAVIHTFAYPSFPRV